MHDNVYDHREPVFQLPLGLQKSCEQYRSKSEKLVYESYGCRMASHFCVEVLRQPCETDYFFLDICRDRSTDVRQL